MQRRRFFTAAGAAALSAASPFPTPLMSSPLPTPTPPLLKPRALREGDTVALLAPSSPISEERIAKSLKNLQALGLKVKESSHWRDRQGYLAGSDRDRLADLHAAFADPEVDGIWCARGGYGAGRLLPWLDYDLIRRHPKVLIGYSDITALHLAIHRMTGLVSFHGPVAASDYPENTLAHLKAAIFSPQCPYTLHLPATGDTLPGPEYSSLVIAAGKARGPLLGGNLALLSALTGTAYTPQFRGKIAFIEDIGEQPYRIDRMLTQLLQGTDLREAAGIVLGVFTDCQPKGDAPTLSLSEALQDRLGDLGIPVAYGFPLGHVPHQATFAYGTLAELDTTAGTLTFLESGVR